MKKETETLPLPAPLLVYIAVALVLGLPLLGSGFILSLDLVYTPNMPLPTDISASYPFRLFIAVLSHVLSAQIVEKAILLGTLLIAGWGAHQLIQKLVTRPKTPAAPLAYTLAPYFAGLLYMINPFVYSRFMAGQISVLLGYALLPFFIASIIAFLSQPTKRTASWTALWLLLISIISIHTVLPAVIVAGVLGGLYLAHNRHNRVWLTQTLRLSGLAIAGLLLVSSYWIIPLLSQTDRTVATVQSFDHMDSIAFAADSGGLGVIGNLLSLRGFWGDGKNLYLVPQDVFNWWLIPILLLWVLVALGIVYSYRKQRGMSIASLLLLLAGLILASGTSGTIFAPLNQFLTDHLPFFSGYREPQKFVVLIALSYAYFGAWGTIALGRIVSRDTASLLHKAVALVLLIPLGLAPLMPLAFHNQLRPRQYPVDWQAIHERLQAENRDSKVLFLPWHMYMRFDFADRIIANPAPMFFGKQIISSNDPELEGAKGNQPTSTAQAQVQDSILGKLKQGHPDAIRELEALGIGYILLAKEQDYKAYDKLSQISGVTMVQETQNLRLYKVQPDKVNTPEVAQ